MDIPYSRGRCNIKIKGGLVDPYTRKQIQEAMRLSRQIPHANIQREIQNALTAAKAVPELSAGYRRFLEANQTLTQQALKDAIKATQMVRADAFRTMVESMQKVRREALAEIINAPIRNALQAPLRQALMAQREAIQDTVRLAMSGWLQEAVRDARRVMSDPSVQAMFENLDPIEDLLEQAEEIEADATEAEAELPENLDEETFMRLNPATLLFIVQYFNTVLTVLMIALAAATLASGPEPVLDSISKGAQIAKGIVELATQALQKKFKEHQNDED